MKSRGDRERSVVYLVRHGESLPRENMSHLEGWSVGLSAWGRREAHATAIWFKKKHLFKIYTSPLARAKETGEEIASMSRTPLTVLDAFAEWAPHPEWKGKQFKDAKRQARTDFMWAPNGGESVQASADRFARGLEQVSGENSAPVAIVSHALVIQNFLMHLTNTHEPVVLPEGSVTTIVHADTGWQVVHIGHEPSFLLRGITVFRKWGKARGVWS